MNLRPGPGKLVVKKVDLENEVVTRNVHTGHPVKIYVRTNESTEAIVAKVTHVAKPWVEDGSDRIINSEYDVGAFVVIGRWTGSRIQLDREEYIVLREEDVLLEIIGDLPKVNLDPSGSLADQDSDDGFKEAMHGASPL